MAFRQFWSDEPVRNSEGVQQSCNDGSQSGENRLLFIGQQLIFDWANEATLNDRLTQSMDLANSE